ncbi:MULTISPECIES: hypothetical protein [Cobetia]|uniref:hypothetical protein n=1 Tax=Cobetia TaxID=204286 RepID=UPI000984AA9D|nr:MULTISPECIES: hypothetical protein [Cobetia]POR06989.1 hypothetical protein BOH68_05020 [Cobetia sp. MM1IDA2H-1]
MKNTRQALREFGASFMGPAFLVYAKEVEAKGAGRVPVCLAREGWCFERLLSHLSTKGHIELEYAPRYLKVSRTLLFRANLGHDFLWPLALANDFEGSMLDLMRKRFGLQMHEAFSALPVELLQMQIKLPEQQTDAIMWLEPHVPRLKALVAPTLEGVMAYLAALGLKTGPQPMMLDLGYSGTIQKLLTRMLERDTHGLYYVTTKQSGNQHGTAVATLEGVFRENASWGDGFQMLDRSLLFESLMTAPHGQVVDVREDSDGGFEFCYGRQAATQRHFQDLQQVFDGAIEQVATWMADGVTFTAEEVEQMYESFTTRQGAIPQCAWHLFFVDDDFSGNGILNPLALFNI